MTEASIDLDGLFCALVLAPRAYARNRFFKLFEDQRARKVRRRAARVRGIIRQLTATGEQRPELLGEQLLDDGRWLVRYRIAGLDFTRTVALSALEAAVLRYALHRAGASALEAADRALVHRALSGLAPELIGVAEGLEEAHPSRRSPADPPGLG